MTHYINFLVMLAFIFSYSRFKMLIFAAYLSLTALMMVAQARYTPLHETSAGSRKEAVANFSVAIGEVAIGVFFIVAALSWESWLPIIVLYALLAARLGLLFRSGSRGPPPPPSSA